MFGQSAVLTDDNSEKQDKWGSTWMLLSKSGKVLYNPVIGNMLSFKEKKSERSRPWTDDYSSLFPIIK